jgi:hypothetical protein
MIARSIAALVLAWLPLSCAPAGSSLKGLAQSVPLILSYHRPSAARSYRGKELCRRCHAGLYSFWSGTGHARSFEDLSGSGDAGRPSCLRCHTTGYGEQTGFVDGQSTPALAAVTCESCHGPAGDHADSRYPDLVPTANGRDCSSCEVSRICRACHTPSRSPGFRLDRALASVSCREAAPGGDSDGDKLLSRREE